VVDGLDCMPLCLCESARPVVGVAWAKSLRDAGAHVSSFERREARRGPSSAPLCSDHYLSCLRRSKDVA
jgi:hypothetical protein